VLNSMGIIKEHRRYGLLFLPYQPAIHFFVDEVADLNPILCTVLQICVPISFRSFKKWMSKNGILPFCAVSTPKIAPYQLGGLNF
jgi:hypothetical protein